MKGDILKWIYTYLLLIITVGWAVFTVIIVRDAIVSLTPMGVIEASGASVLLGALITWNSSTNKYWFRKKAPD